MTGTIGAVTSEESATATDTAATTRETTPDPGPAGPVTFRPVPLPALVAVGFLAIGISPIAFNGGPWFLVFLLPLALAWWVLRTRTVVDDESLRVLSVRGSRRTGWDEVATLRVVDRGWVRAVQPDEAEVPLVGVRTRDLGRLAGASGGRITMPTPEEIEAAREHERELEATRMRIARLREAREARDAEAAVAESDEPGDEPGDVGGDTDAQWQPGAPADTPGGQDGDRA